ncbi:hypothetical protein A2U01_0104247, partial [Trifolium medium]|nr:hypothetical protein [Trifolium medium]
NGTLAYGEGS